MHTYIRRRRGILVLTMQGDVRFWNRPAIERECHAALLAIGLPQSGEKPDGVVLNLRGVTRLDARAIGFLTRVPAECAAFAIPLLFIAPGGLAGRVLHSVRILRKQRRFRNEGSAIRAANAIRQRLFAPATHHRPAPGNGQPMDETRSLKSGHGG